MKQFEMIRLKKPKRAMHDLSHEVKLTMDMGKLVPFLCMETLPGDKFNINMETLIRMQALLAPVMHRINAYAHFFFVPNRIIWDDWQDFITGGRTGNLEPNHPKFIGDNEFFASRFTEGSLADYLGIPIGQYPSESSIATPVSQLPFRAYYQIINDYYRDQNFRDEIEFPKDSLDINLEGYSGLLTDLYTRCWEKDYFTSALPSAQRGDQVLLPLTGDAPVSGRPYVVDPVTGLSVKNLQYFGTDSQGKLKYSGAPDIPAELRNSANLQADSNFVADLSAASSTTINDLRRSYALQRWMETMMRAGYRYVEQILAIFGVKSSDARLQRAEYIGGGKLPMRIGEVLQTSETNQTPQGNIAGRGILGGDMSSFSKYFEEHGFIIGIISVMPRTAYQQGLPRIFSKFDRFDYFWPQFAHIGEQELYNREIYLSSNEVNDEGVFGYQPRYSEYRYAPDVVRGKMRTSQSFYHMGRIFNALPLLNNNFVTADPTTRIYPVIEEDSGALLVQLYLSIHAFRPVPKFGDPI